MTTNDPGQDDGTAVDVNGVIQLDQAAQVQALFPGQTITPSQDFNFSWNGVIVQFYGGQSATVTPDLLAALTAQGAPFAQP